LLYGPRRGPVQGVLSRHEQTRMMNSVDEAQKRLWILFRMVHLSSVLPCEVHGQLCALVERYLRPVVVERRMPLDRRPTLEGPDADGRGALLDVPSTSTKAEVYDMASQDEKEAWRAHHYAQEWTEETRQCIAAKSWAWRPSWLCATAESPSKTRGDLEGDAEQESPRPTCALTSLREGGKSSRRSDCGSVDEDSLDSFYDGSSASGSSRRNADRCAVDTGKVLRKLTATRTDIARVLSRLRSEALLGPCCQSHPQSHCVLSDIFSSIVLVLPGSCLTAPGNAEAAVRDAAEGRIVVAASTGFHYGSRAYAWQGLHTSLNLDVAISSSDAKDMGVSVGDLLVEVSVPLTLMLDEEPPQVAATSAWSSLTAAQPLLFGEASLKSRRRALRRAKDVVRSMSSGRRALTQ